MEKYKNSIIAGIAIILIISVWFVNTRNNAELTVERADTVIPTDGTASAETEQPPATTQNTQNTAPEPSMEKVKPRVVFAQSAFTYDIHKETTPCGDHIGSLDILSSDPKQELHWGMTGSKPLWISFSRVVGKTPARVEMNYNCILSGADDTTDWTFTVTEMTPDGKYIDGRASQFTITGAIN